MTYSVPTSFEPLASSNPVPADTDALTSLGQQYTATAQLIQSQAQTLTNLSNNSSDSWKSQAGTVFVSKASSLATRITQAQQRYATAGTALTNAAEPMYQAQQQAYAAVQQAQEAQSTMNANAPGPTPAPGSPAPTAAQQAAAKTAASNYSTAQDSLNQATSQFNSAVDDYKDAASAAAKAINDELGSDPLKDSWFQAHFGWLLNFFHILAIIVMALAAIALIICLPGVGAVLDGIGLGALGSIIGWGSFAIGMGQTIFDGVAAGEGLESWKSFGLDLVGDVTFGVGQGASKIASTVAKSATDATESAASAAAKTSVIDKATADGSADFIKNNATTTISNDDLAAAAKAAGETAGKGAAAAAETAGKSAAESIAKSLEGVEKATGKSLTGNLQGFAFQNGDIANSIAKLNSIAGTAPASAKVGTAINKVIASGVVNGVTTLGAFGVAGYGLSPAAG
jgi:uncharacterized protein YukE